MFTAHLKLCLTLIDSLYLLPKETLGQSFKAFIIAFKMINKQKFLVLVQKPLFFLVWMNGFTTFILHAIDYCMEKQL